MMPSRPAARGSGGVTEHKAEQMALAAKQEAMLDRQVEKGHEQSMLHQASRPTPKQHRWEGIKIFFAEFAQPREIIAAAVARRLGGAVH